MSTETLIPLLVAVPLLAGAVLAAGDDHIPRRVPDLLAPAASAFVAVASCLLLIASLHHRILYWFGGWQPVHGLALGVDFVVEPLSAGIAALAGTVVTGVFVFSWRYFEEVRHLFHTLVLAFLAGLVGFALSGDLFNIFVWLELISVAAYALCGYQVRRKEVIQGAFNFAVVNSLGAFTLVLGIGLVYGRTGALNLSQISASLAQRPPDALVVVAFSLITVGLLVKAGSVPFHFWLSDAYAVAPAPVGALFAGVMTDLAFHALAKIYWDGFSETFAPHAGQVRAALLALAVATLVVGAVMCILQADLKRQLAFASVNNGGVLLAGIAVQTPGGLAGATLREITGGLLRAAMFLAVAVVIQTHRADDEITLRGRGRRRESVLPATVIVLSALGLASLPPFGTFLSVALIMDGSHSVWIDVVITVSTAAVAATFLRAAARIFLGWGVSEDTLLTRQKPARDEPEEPADVKPGRRRLMLIPVLVLLALSFAAARAPGIAGHMLTAAHTFENSAATSAEVLHGIRADQMEITGYSPSAAAWGYGIGCSVLAIAFAAFGLWGQRFATGLRALLLPPVRVAKAVHSGILGDYVLWMMTGTGVLAGAWLLALRG